MLDRVEKRLFYFRDSNVNKTYIRYACFIFEHYFEIFKTTVIQFH